MHRTTMLLVVSAASLLACAPNLRQQAVVTATAVHDAVAVGIPAWEAYVDERVRFCEAQGLRTRTEGEQCLGPAGKATEVRQALEALTAVQLGLYVALTDDRTAPEVRRALAELLQRFGTVATYWRDAGVCTGTCANVVDKLWAKPRQ